jgi:protein-S-isoprenylcysteine O-methyltransferase Ste14
MKSTSSTPYSDSALLEWLLRAFALVVLGIAVTRWAHAWWIDPSRWTALLLLVAEGYTLLLVVFARRASRRDMTPLPMLATIYASCYIVLLNPEGTVHLAPELAGVALQLFSTVITFAAKVTLGRSFGLLPAQRGVVVAGPYRLVRHPVYMGYLIGHIGFLLANFSWRNAAVLAVLYVAQVVRITREEAVLASSDEYRSYQRRVRWRLVPYIF